MTDSQSTGTCPTSPARELRVPIIEHQELTPVVRRLVLDAPGIAREGLPGQFVHVLCGAPGISYDPLLRRPFSLHDADSKTGRISLLYEIKGRGTALLAESKPGERLSIIGPLGQGFALTETADQPLLLIAGGIAVAPLHLLARRLKETVGSDRTTVLIGARSECLLICLEEYQSLALDVRVATDDGTAGFHGLVTGLLQQYVESIDCLNPPLVYACGPMPMLKTVAGITKDRGLKCQVSTEAKMACGVGACMSCVVKIRSGDSVKYLRCCKAGPVFDADSIVWE